MKIPVGANTTDDADVRIIGVVGDFKNAGLVVAPEPHITVLYAQHPIVNYGFKDIVIRTAGDPHLLEPEIGRQLHGLDADLPFSDVRTFEEMVEQQMGGQRFTTLLLSLFALAGLVLAVVGVYGVTSYLVARRTQEMAVRLALERRRGIFCGL
jgi:putative ABC transport system permease protein